VTVVDMQCMVVEGAPNEEECCRPQPAPGRGALDVSTETVVGECLAGRLV
jgi:hypothetical protein